MDDRITVYQGDCLDVLRNLPANSVDAVVTDPPAGIGFMDQDWDNPNSFPLQDRGKRLTGNGNPTDARGFVKNVTFNKSKKARDTFIVFLSERLHEALRVAKPGANMLCWALPRTSHWTACAIEDAGWKLEDRVAHIFGTGFPKHKSKLKPAVEDWWLATKPGGEKWLGVDACRIVSGEETLRVTTGCRDGVAFNCADDGSLSKPRVNGSTAGRWPANLVLSHHPDCKPNGVKQIKGNPTGDPQRSTTGTETVQVFECHTECPARTLDEQSGELTSGSRAEGVRKGMGYHLGALGDGGPAIEGSIGGASRFFPRFLYCQKANRNDRGEGNNHPTVKAEPLMRWLVKLVTKPGGTVLDPFAGSGSTGFAAEAEGFNAILIEQSPEYVEIIKRRMANFQEQTPLFK